MDYSELVRVVLGFAAFVVAGAQITMRWMIAHNFPRSRSRSRAKERSTSVAMMLLLTGIGLGNLTHLSYQLTVSTAVISAGVCVAAGSLVDIFQWGKEEADVTSHRQRPTRGGN